MRFFLIAGLILAIVASAAQAEPVFQRLTGSNQHRDQCFARFYDAQHLQRHPRQRVIRFRLRRDRNGPDDVNNPARFTVAMGFRTTDRRELFEVHGICTTRGAIAECGGEGDAGSFRIALAGQNLQVEIERLELEGSGPDLAASDDRVFLLRPAPPKECEG